MKLNRSRSIEVAIVEAKGWLDRSRVSLVGSTPRPGVDQVEGENGVASWFRSRNQIRLFGPFTYMHMFAYQIMGPEFRYNLRMC